MKSGMRITITPADVGHRVSVRSRHHGAPGSPAMTDTVGELIDWADGRLRIRRRDGSVAVVAEPDLLAGKVIGHPPPAARGRYPR